MPAPQRILPTAGAMRRRAASIIAERRNCGSS
jgi:hypothetical protein